MVDRQLLVAAALSRVAFPSRTGFGPGQIGLPPPAPMGAGGGDSRRIYCDTAADVSRPGAITSEPGAASGADS